MLKITRYYPAIDPSLALKDDRGGVKNADVKNDGAG
jgi:hypothetical protein